MIYLVYILAAFGIFSLLVLFIKFVMWSLDCDIKNQFVPIGESEVYTMRSNSLTNESEAIEQMDKMLEQYTKPKTIVSRQCICPFCAKEVDKLIIKDHNSNVRTYENESTEVKIEEEEPKDDVIVELIEDDNTVIEVHEFIAINDGSSDDMQCKLYNNVVSQLKDKFNASNNTIEPTEDQLKSED